jgi:hypothetical protein
MRWGGRRRSVVASLAAGVLVVVGAAWVIYSRSGWYGLNVVPRRGWTTWRPTGPDDPEISAAMRLALRRPVPAAVPGGLSWRAAADGFETAELPVLVDGHEVDRILLTRIDPSRFRFRVLSRPEGDRELGDWMRATGAALVVNGSYFAADGLPDTPVLSDGHELGPQDYLATHGALVAGPDGATLRDLTGTDWRSAFAGARDGLVSYPMLIGANGEARTTATGWDWLANRSFLGQDGRGRILVGTTQDAFFSLERLAAFLRAAPLDLRLALNLDGGPIACQGVRLGAVTRDFCGRWETQDRDGQVQVLGSRVGSRRYALPLVLAVQAR